MSTGLSTPAADTRSGHDGALDAYADRPVLARRRPGRVVAAIVVLALVAEAAHGLAANPVFQWDVFGYWFFRPIILEGLRLTLWLTAAGAVFGFLGGIVLALMRQSGNPVLQSVAWVYIWIFRSIPLIVVLLFLANISVVSDTISVGIPFGPTFGEWDTLDLLSYEAAAIVGISLNEAAYASEIIRGGILSVDAGQVEAAEALGLPKRRQLTRIVLPQATRSIVPNYCNQLTGLLKGTSVVYITSLLDLFGQVQTQASRNQGELIPLLVVASVWYIVLISVLSVVQYYVERHYSRGAQRGGAADADAEDPVGGPHPARGGPMTVPAVEIRGVRKAFGGPAVLDGIDLVIEPGTVTAILGPSGSGKSTLLRTINHLERPDRGFVRVHGELIGVRPHRDRLKEIHGRELLRQRGRIGFVFQGFNLFSHLTALENVVEAPVVTQGRPKAEARAEARDLLASVGLADKADAYPRQLSGGQQQRVAIARALALKPSLILFDEPTSALDPELVGEVLAVIRRLAATGTTLVIVTHEIGFAREIADQVVFLDAGRVVAAGPPSVVIDAPEHPRVAEFLSKVL